MMLEQKIEQDIKAAQLGGDTFRLTTLRGLKATLLNVKVATGKRDTGLTDEEVLPILAKESKKRQESADMYKQGHAEERAAAELAEKAIIDAYLPAQLDDTAIADLIDAAITATSAEGVADLGKVIGWVKGQAGASADGATIAKLTREKLS